MNWQLVYLCNGRLELHTSPDWLMLSAQTTSNDWRNGAITATKAYSKYTQLATGQSRLAARRVSCALKYLLTVVETMCVEAVSVRRDTEVVSSDCD